ncbi:MAG: RluA family pseudouridine synthase [Ruthenibacterium sp.]
MRTISLHITPEWDGRSVKSLLKFELQLSTHLISRLKREESGICLNGERVFVTALVHTGDVLTAEVGDHERGSRAVLPIDFPLELVWEDEDLLALNKPAGLLLHPSTLTPDAPTVAGALAYYLGEGSVFHAVNRLDKDTSGLMLVAKSGFLHDRMRLAQAAGTLHRSYLALAVGTVFPPSGRIDAPIGRDPSSILRRRIDENGASAITDYETLCHANNLTLLRLLPQTGRTHQLRVHLASRGYPLAGDWLYGAQTRIGRTALHSAELWFVHPLSGKDLHFTVPIPQDMQSLLEDAPPSPDSPVSPLL